MSLLVDVLEIALNVERSFSGLPIESVLLSGWIMNLAQGKSVFVSVKTKSSVHLALHNLGTFVMKVSSFSKSTRNYYRVIALHFLFGQISTSVLCTEEIANIMERALIRFEILIVTVWKGLQERTVR